MLHIDCLMFHNLLSRDSVQDSQPSHDVYYEPDLSLDVQHAYVPNTSDSDPNIP